MPEQNINRAVIDTQGQLLTDTPFTEIIPVTELGPVLNGAILEGLPGPCLPVPDPVSPRVNVPTGCRNVQAVRRFQLISNLTTEKATLVSGQSTQERQQSVWVCRVQVARNQPVRVFFDFDQLPDNIMGGGISLLQSRSAAPTDWTPSSAQAWFDDTSTFLRRDTRSDGTEQSNNGQQIGTYGVTAWSDSQTALSSQVQNLFGLADQLDNRRFAVGGAIVEPDGAPQRTLLPSTSAGNVLPMYARNAELRVKGYGFIQRQIDCDRGEYVTVIVTLDSFGIDPTTTDNLLWQIVVEYEQEYQPPQTQVELCTDQQRNAPSRQYRDGAVLTEWAAQNTFGYFGQVARNGETVGASDGPDTAPLPVNRHVDNIYYPYSPAPTDYLSFLSNPNYVREPGRWAQGPGVTRVQTRTIQSLEGRQSFSGPFRTIEIKGYFRAPFTGRYVFSGAAVDGLWLWISSRPGTGLNRIGVPDTATNEFFVQDGFQGGTSLSSRNYNRNNYVLRTGQRTANTGTRFLTSPVSIELSEGEYYFVRLLSGTHDTAGFFEVYYDVVESGIKGSLVFSGKRCPEDDPPADQTTVTPGTSTGGGGDGGVPPIGTGGFPGGLSGSSGGRDWWWWATEMNLR